MIRPGIETRVSWTIGEHSTNLVIIITDYNIAMKRNQKARIWYINYVKLFYHYGFSDYCLHVYYYFHNVLADISSGLIQVFVELGNLQQDIWRNGYRRWFPELLRRQSSEGCRFNPHYRRVTIQEYLTLVSGYGRWNQNRRPPWFQ